MKQGLAFWTAHMAAIKEAGISTSAYAKRHDLPLTSLYYWQRQVRLAAVPAKVVASKPFVALRVSAPAAAGMAPVLSSSPSSSPLPSTACALVLACGMRLELPALPSPAWLSALDRCAAGAR